MNKRHLAALVLAALLSGLGSGCAIGPDYLRPKLPEQESFRGHQAGESGGAYGDLGWRAVYVDPPLQALIEEALAAAPDLQLAEARVREAEAVAGVVRADLYPRLDATFTTSPIPLPDGKDLAANFTGGASVTWQIDLWGRLRRADEAGRADLLASEAAWRGVMASLVADVAGRYFQLVASHSAYAVAERTAANQRAALHLVSRLSAAGIATDAEIRQQEVALAITEATLPQLRREIVRSENGLSILLGRVPGAIAIDEQHHVPLPEAIPAGLPSRLLEARPDLLAAEQQLVAANARVGEAKARFFPDISLTGLFGGVSTEAADLFTGGAATVASLGANALQPLFAGKRYLFNYQAALARLDQALISYRKAVLFALADTSAALTDFLESGEILLLQKKRAASAREALRLSEARYRAGVVSFIEVLDAQRQLFIAETEEVESLLDRRLALRRVYLALGGGWERAE